MSIVNLGRFWSQLSSSNVSSHTEELWYNETASQWMTIYMLSSQVLSTLAKELAAATRLMQSFSNELSSLLSDSAKM